MYRFVLLTFGNWLQSACIQNKYNEPDAEYQLLWSIIKTVKRKGRTQEDGVAIEDDTMIEPLDHNRRAEIAEIIGCNPEQLPREREEILELLHDKLDQKRERDRQEHAGRGQAVSDADEKE